MTGDSFDILTAEQRARGKIDTQLVTCGWTVQDYHHAAVRAAQGVAVREMPTTAGRADYVLFVDGQAVGVIEAKKAGTTLTGVEWQTRRYQTSFPHELPACLVDEDCRSATNPPVSTLGFPAGWTRIRHLDGCSRSIGPRRSPAGRRDTLASRTASPPGTGPH